MKRCEWAQGVDEEYEKYHDEEWGVPVHDDLILFEFLLLEGAQAGLSWATILKKRENYRKAFDGFDYRKIAFYNDQKYEELLKNPGIVRNKLKIKAAILNAQKFIKVQAEFGSFDRYLWGFVGGKPIINSWQSMAEVPSSSEISDWLAKDLKKRGFKFVGTKIVYAYMQAVGLVNDHILSCDFR